MGNLKGKTAIVTGASKGIGAQIARALGAAGASVAVNYASDRQGAEHVVADIVRADGRALAIQGDVAKRADVVRLFAETRRAFGPVDVLSTTREYTVLLRSTMWSRTSFTGSSTSTCSVLC